MDIDPAFRNAGAKAKARRQKRNTMRALVALGSVLGVVALGAGVYVLAVVVDWGGGTDDPMPTLADGGSAAAAPADPDPFEVVEGGTGDEDFAMVQTEGSAEMAISVPPSADAFLNLRKDPMVLRLEQSEASEENTLSGPLGLDQRRVGPANPDRLTLLTDDLVIQETRLVTTIPSSAEDLAFFQAQRSQGIAEMAEQQAAAAQPTFTSEVGEGQEITVDGDDGSWGELIDTGLGDAPQTDQVTYVETVIQNNTSSAFTLRDSQRFPLYDDTVVVIRTERELTEVLTSNGFGQADAERITGGVERVLALPTTLTPGSLVAIRTKPDVTGETMTQMAIYGPDGYLGSMAQTGLGRFAPAADPWIEEDLLELSGEVRQEAASTGEIRLIDAIYSAAIRNGLPTTLVGELIVMMSQDNDLDRFAAVGDKVTILYGTNEVNEGQGPGRVLFAGVDGPSGTIDCYVTFDEEAGAWGCFDFNAPGGGGGGLVIPVAGTKTSDFGPRFHPILKQMRNHNGVDWAAPTGTPIVSALPGVIEYAGPGGGYGNVVYVKHEGGLQTRYAHMNAYSELGRGVGNVVNAGDVIGYVGTTGRSTGPHLHFELWQNGTPIDPLTFTGSVGGGPAGGYSDGGQPGSDAVEALVNQIIAVESGGNANAANPLSTAVGLGQFIESTWIRMMQTYRPDLVASMSRQQLLNLRTDPALSREMVRNLARENEAFLRARGHAITPGRLYLAHFLGPGGAHTSLSAAGNVMVIDVMGAGVVNANPFLRGKTNADMWAWSDRKMGNSSATAASYAPAVTVRAIPPEVKEFKDLVDAMLGRVEDEDGSD